MVHDAWDPLDDGSVPDGLRERAEQVRAHFVMLRAGGPFLSPTDAACLVRWLDEGVPVSRLLVAIEQAAEARRKSRARSPFHLSRAAPYLRRAPAAPPRRRPVEREVSPSLPPLADLAPALAPLDPHAAAAAADLTGEPEALFEAAMSLIRTAFERAWDRLTPADRAARCERAARPLAEFREELDDASWEQLVEEGARDSLRAEHPALSAVVVHGMLFG